MTEQKRKMFFLDPKSYRKAFFGCITILEFPAACTRIMITYYTLQEPALIEPIQGPIPGDFPIVLFDRESNTPKTHLILYADLDSSPKRHIKNIPRISEVAKQILYYLENRQFLETE